MTCDSDESCITSTSGGYVCYKSPDATCSSSSFSNCDPGWTIKADTSSLCSGDEDRRLTGKAIQPFDFSSMDAETGSEEKQIAYANPSRLIKTLPKTTKTTEKYKRKLINSRNLATDYKEMTSGSCSGDWEEPSSAADCRAAMSACSSCSGKGEDFISGAGKTSGSYSDGSASSYPSGCYFYTKTCTTTKCSGNYYNSQGQASYSSTRRGVCKKKAADTSTNSGANTGTTSSPSAAKCTANCKTCLTSDCCTADPCNSTYVENSDKSTVDSIKGNTDDTVRVTCADGFLTNSQTKSSLATCRADGTFSKVICCKHCVPPEGSFEWAVARNVPCTKGTVYSGCDCTDNAAGTRTLGQTCNIKTALPTFGYNRVSMTKDEDCKMTSVDFDVCMTDNDATATSTSTAFTRGAVFPASWHGNT